VEVLGPAGVQPALKLRTAAEMLARERASSRRRWGWRGRRPGQTPHR
jgi:hypothetical protein